MINLMIWGGGFLAAIGFIGLVCLAIEPLQKSFEVVFKRNDDYVAYETDRGRALLARETSKLMTVSVVFLLAGLALMLSGLFLKNSPRGNDTLLSESGEGVTQGEDQSENPQAQGRTQGGKYISADGREFPYYIAVTGTEISFSGAPMSGTAELESALESFDRGYTIYLVDDYAASATYRAVEDLLDRYGMQWEQDE